jgi:hypothetical protein
MQNRIDRIKTLAGLQDRIDETQGRELIRLVSGLFRDLMLAAGHNARQITRLTTKFRDAGRRSAPWRATSSRVPGRPQDGANGNRINRWLLDKSHKFYADEVTATLVEIKYYLQALSMSGAPELPDESLKSAFSWMLEHKIEPGNYVDPIQLVPINIHDVVRDARTIQSGHLIPLDRGGKHEPRNAFLMLPRSNQLQGNQTRDELLALMEEILARHKGHTR